jgi:hypothetical protein
MATKTTKSTKSTKSVPVETPVVNETPVVETPVETSVVNETHEETHVDETKTAQEGYETVLSAFKNLNAAFENMTLSKIKQIEYVQTLTELEKLHGFLAKLHRHGSSKIRTQIQKKHDKQVAKNEGGENKKEKAGISSPMPVPPSLRKFLGLDDKNYARTTITRLCTAKLSKMNIEEHRDVGDNKTHKFYKATPELREVFMLTPEEDYMKSSEFQQYLKRPYVAFKEASS